MVSCVRLRRFGSGKFVIGTREETTSKIGSGNQRRFSTPRVFGIRRDLCHCRTLQSLLLHSYLLTYYSLTVVVHRCGSTDNISSGVRCNMQSTDFSVTQSESNPLWHCRWRLSATHDDDDGSGSWIWNCSETVVVRSQRCVAIPQRPSPPAQVLTIIIIHSCIIVRLLRRKAAAQ